MTKKPDRSDSGPGAGRSGKTRITIRIDSDVLDWFRDQVGTAGGGSYQTLINQALRDAMTRQAEPLEKLLRRVIRKELRRRKTR